MTDGPLRQPLLESGGKYSHVPAPRCCFWLPSHINVRKCVAGVMMLSVFSILFYGYYVTALLARLLRRDQIPRPLKQCSLFESQQKAQDHRSGARLQSDAKVLVIVESS